MECAWIIDGAYLLKAAPGLFDYMKLKNELEKEERDVSYRRRILHGKIDILRAEYVARLQSSGGRSVLDEVDVDRLTEILTGKAVPPA